MNEAAKKSIYYLCKIDAGYPLKFLAKDTSECKQEIVFKHKQKDKI